MTQERTERNARIIKRATQIWSDEGGPLNRHEAQWLMAMRQIDDEDREGQAAAYVQSSVWVTGLEGRSYRETLEQSASTVANEETIGLTRVSSRIGAVTQAASRFFTGDRRRLRREHGSCSANASEQNTASS